jgi:hypothetical protein
MTGTGAEGATTATSPATGREHAIRRLDELSAGQRPRWTLVDAQWTPALANAASQDNGSPG